MLANTRTFVFVALLGPALSCDSSDAPPKPSAGQGETKPSDRAGKDEPFKVVVVENSGDLGAVLADHVAKAKAAGLKPYAEFWASWCPPCKAIEESMGDARMRDAFSGAYLIRLDSDHWGSKLAGSGFEAASIPVFYELDEAGKPTGRKIDGGAWGDNTPENMAPPLAKFFHAK